MGYFQDIVSNLDISLIFLALGIAVMVLALFWLIFYFVNSKKDRWKADTKMDTMVTKQKDTIDKFIGNIESQMMKSKISMNAKNFVIITAVISLLLFIVSLRHFKNFPASILIAVTFFSIPEYVFFLIQDKINKKIEDQIVVGVRVFTSEFLKSKNMEKSMAETSKRVLDPVGEYFADAYADMLMGYGFETVVTRLNAKSDNEYWKMFTQLLFQLRDNSSVIDLFTDLVLRIERNIEATRHSDSTLSGERTLALIMSLVPIPAYLLMRRVIPETTYFITETAIGRFTLIGSFVSTLLFLYVDKYSRKTG